MGAQFDTFLGVLNSDDGVGSIADAVSSFITLGGLNTASLPDLFISTQCWLDRRIREMETLE
jgi:hypothetical protein